MRNGKMKCIPVLIVFVLNVTSTFTRQKANNVTLNVHERVALLKLQIAKAIEQKKTGVEKISPIDNQHDALNSYEYVEVGSIITPIMDYDERKSKHRYKLRQLKTTQDPDLTTNTPKMQRDNKRSKTKHQLQSSGDVQSQESTTKKKYIMPIAAEDSSKEDKKDEREIDKALETLNIPANKHGRSRLKTKIDKFNANPILLTKKHRRKKKGSSDSLFYRRYSGNYDNMNKKFVHCQDLITPFLTGHKTNMTEINKKLTYKDRSVLRVIQLIGEDTTGYTTEEVYSILYQISNIQIRLFQWDVPSLKLLFNVVMKENMKSHTFRALKNGLKSTLNAWNIDFTNTTNLLKQARLFRPPCIRGPGQDGSTRTSKVVRYTTPEIPKCSGESDSGDCI